MAQISTVSNSRVPILRRLRNHVMVFLAVLGPGFITAVVDNDSGGIFTYSQAGARWGYLPLWTLLPITVVLILTQEMCSRMGAVTGKGLSDLIREEFGLRMTFIVMLLLVAVNFPEYHVGIRGASPVHWGSVQRVAVDLRPAGWRAGLVPRGARQLRKR